MTKAAANNAGLGLLGTWELQVNTLFGRHPATLTLTSDGGEIQSQLGNIALEEIRYEGDSFTARVAYHTQGRVFTATVSARHADGRMDGLIKVDLPLAPPVKFTGTRRA